MASAQLVFSFDRIGGTAYHFHLKLGVSSHRMNQLKIYRTQMHNFWAIAMQNLYSALKDDLGAEDV